MERFRGKVAIVTGGASGIGREIGLQIGAAGATVVLVDLNEELAAEAAAAIQSAGARRGRCRSTCATRRRCTRW